MRAIEMVVMGAPRSRRPAVGGAAAGPPHPHAGRARAVARAAPAPPRPASAADGLAAAAIADGTRQRRAPSQTAKMIDIAQVQGQVHAQSVQKVGELADKNPHETVSIIRHGCTRARPERA